MRRRRKKEHAGIVHEQTGMSQTALARYIGAKQSTLSHYLAGTRLLPGAAGLKLMNLTVKLLQLPPQPPIQTFSAAEQQELQQAAEWCRLQCFPLQKKLKTMQEEATRAARLLQLVSELAQVEPVNDTPQRWYDSQRDAAQARLTRNDQRQQLAIMVKIALLQTEAAICEAAVQGEVL